MFRIKYLYKYQKKKLVNYLKEKNKNIKTKKSNYSTKYKIFIILIFFLFAILLIRIGYLQFFKASFLKEKAYEQLVTSRIISTKRGTIYDSSGNQLAISSRSRYYIS